MSRVSFLIVRKTSEHPELLVMREKGRVLSTGLTGWNAICEEQWRGFSLIAKACWDDGIALEPIESLTHKELLPPAPCPREVIGVGKSYSEHAKEFGVSQLVEPDYFLISPTALTGSGSPITLPDKSVASKIDYEGEIVVVLGKRIKNATVEEAQNAILGITLGNDVTARDLQIEKQKPWSLSKSLDTFKPLGPYVRVVEDSRMLEDLCIKTIVSGEVMQEGCVSEMVMSLPQLVANISRYLTLRPGDLVYTGTPPGVGYARSPPRLLRRGDVVRVELASPREWGMVLENPVE